MFRREHKNRQNLLEMSPVLNGTIQLVAEEEKYTAQITRTSWPERLSTRYLRQPSVIQVKLDVLGDTVLRHCDGKRTVLEISEVLTERFGTEAEPVVPRLVKFLQIVEINGWIGWKR